MHQPPIKKMTGDPYHGTQCVTRKINTKGFTSQHPKSIDLIEIIFLISTQPHWTSGKRNYLSAVAQLLTVWFVVYFMIISGVLFSLLRLCD
jgi:hypothetical protein